MSKLRKKVVLSIPVHQELKVLKDQINNINHFVEDVLIVVHISENIAEDARKEKIEQMENVIINPKHLPTTWGNILGTHISNFELALEKVNFDYFMFHSSNDMYVRKGVTEYVYKYDAGFNFRYVDGEKSFWCMSKPAYNDGKYTILRRLIEADRIVASQVEGSFYKKIVLEKAIGLLKSYYPDYNVSSDLLYTKEEFLIPTIVSTIVKAEKVGKPTTFSEVHRFDRIYYRYLKISDRVLKNNKCKMIVDELVNRMLFSTGVYKITSRDIDAIRNNNTHRILKNSILDDGFGEFQLYDAENLYSVKRVPRNYNNKIRRRIRKIIKKEEEDY